MQNEVSQAPKVRALLAEAAEALQQSRQSLFREEPDYPTSLAGSLQALRRAFQAFTTWHGMELPEDAPLRAFTRRAVPLASMLRMYEKLALPMEPLAEELLARCDCSRVKNRQSVERGYYTARNAFYTIFDELPTHLRPATAVPRSEAFVQ